MNKKLMFSRLSALIFKIGLIFFITDAIASDNDISQSTGVPTATQSDDLSELDYSKMLALQLNDASTVLKKLRYEHDCKNFIQSCSEMLVQTGKTPIEGVSGYYLLLGIEKEILKRLNKIAVDELWLEDDISPEEEENRKELNKLLDTSRVQKEDLYSNLTNFEKFRVNAWDNLHITIPAIILGLAGIGFLTYAVVRKIRDRSNSGSSDNSSSGSGRKDSPKSVTKETEKKDKDGQNKENDDDENELAKNELAKREWEIKKEEEARKKEKEERDKQTDLEKRELRLKAEESREKAMGELANSYKLSEREEVITADDAELYLSYCTENLSDDTKFVSTVDDIIESLIKRRARKDDDPFRGNQISKWKFWRQEVWSQTEYQFKDLDKSKIAKPMFTFAEKAYLRALGIKDENKGKNDVLVERTICLLRILSHRFFYESKNGERDQISGWLVKLTGKSGQEISNRSQEDKFVNENYVDCLKKKN
jgi:hypothetical protein